MTIQDIPNYADPIEIAARPGGALGGRFTNNWLDWLIKLAQAMQDKQNEIPLGFTTPAPVAGPGPVEASFQFTARRAASILVTGTAIQNFVTAAPTWELALFVDTAFFTTGAVSSWQSVVHISHLFAIGPGLHTVRARWTAGSANATINSLTTGASFAYT